MDPEAFWRVTPRVLKAHLDGVSKRLRREHDERAWLAWHVAALTRAKKMPKLKELQAPKSARRKTWQEQLAAVRAFDAALNRKKRHDK